MATSSIETLIEKGEWESAQRAVERQLAKEPDDHWLHARLSGVKYEQGRYQEALDAAEKALEIVPDCPLALWSYAGALDVVRRTQEAGEVYARLYTRGIEQLRNPDEDADECWEGADWTRRLVMDCILRIGDALAKIGRLDEAPEWYRLFLTLLDHEAVQGIHTRDDAIARLKKLMPGKKPGLEMADRMNRLKEAMALSKSDAGDLPSRAGDSASGPPPSGYRKRVIVSGEGK